MAMMMMKIKRTPRRSRRELRRVAVKIKAQPKREREWSD
jgi:hypothetical protein